MTFSTDLFLEYKRRPGTPALARLLERHQDAVYALCLQVLHHRQDAEDACQEILLEVTRQVNEIEEPDRFSGWLYRTALHTALDVKRRRGRQRDREAVARRVDEAPASPGSEELHRGLAALDDSSRQLVVDHYLGRRTLRELAAERGVSEVSVWKRIEGARERLRKTLGAAPVAALEKAAAVRAPAGLLKHTLIQGGFLVAASGALKLAVVAPLVLLAGAAIVMTARRPDPPRSVPTATPIAGTAAATVRAGPTATGPAIAGAAPRRGETSTATVRRPYPYRPVPVPSEKAAAAHTWQILSTRRISLEETDAEIADILERLGRREGLTIAVDPGSLEGETLSVKLHDMGIDLCLWVMLDSSGKGYEIRPDGAVRVGNKADLKGGYEQEAREIRNIPAELDEVRQMLDGGWNGLDLAAPAPSADRRGTKTIVPQGETCLRDELRRLEEAHGITARVQLPTDTEEERTAWKEMVDKRFLQVVEERTLAAHLDQLARRNGLVVASSDGSSFTLTTEWKAADLRAMAEKEKRERDETLRKFAAPLPVSGVVPLLDLFDAQTQASGWPVLPSEPVWDSGASVTLPPGATLRDSLEALKAHGIRWGFTTERIYIVK
jgi:RNA polymerase sigma-70 factor (ECF subfamily)